ncbi:MAG: DNA polymerase, partial [Dehalococcoidia bacterium]
SGGLDARVYPRFNQAGDFDEDDRIAPRTGRLSSSGPNLQNQPGAIRAIYVAPDGKVWWSFDESQLELRIAAAASGDPNMVAAYVADPPLDLHQQLVDKVLEMTGREIPRVAAKGGNFSRKYGADYAQLRNISWKNRVPMSNEVAKAIIEGHDAQFGGWIDYADWEGKAGLDRGYGETIVGGRRGYRDVDMNDLGSVAGAKRFFVNHSIQGTAALIVKKLMLDITPVLLKYDAHCCNQTHDELNGWCDRDVVEPFLAEVTEIAENMTLPNGIPLRIETGFGRSWADAH